MEDNIFEKKLDEKMRSILSLRIKIGLSQDYEFGEDFESRYINIRLDELILDVEDLISVAEDDIRAEIEMDIELEKEANIDEQFDEEQNNYWS